MRVADKTIMYLILNLQLKSDISIRSSSTKAVCHTSVDLIEF